MIRKNPVYEKEMWSSANSRVSAVFVIGFHFIMALIALSVFGSMEQLLSGNGKGSYSGMLQMYMVLGMAECAVLVAVVPWLAGCSIVSERERGTFDQMKVSGIRPYRIVSGKLFAVMNTAGVTVISSFPALSMVFVYGGIRIRDLLWAAVVLMITAFYLGSISLLFSASVRRTSQAVLASYGAVFALVGGTLLVHYLPVLLFGSAYGEKIGSSIAWYHYLLLLNPVVTFYGVLNDQAGSKAFLFDLINDQGNYQPNAVTDHWVLISLLLQLVLAAAAVFLAVRIAARRK